MRASATVIGIESGTETASATSESAHVGDERKRKPGHPRYAAVRVWIALGCVALTPLAPLRRR